MNEIIEAAVGRKKADIVFKNAKVVDVFTHSIRETDVAVKNGFIIGFGEYDGKEEIDVNGKYIMPSFIDSHLHIESSMLSPSEYAAIVVPKGVGAIIADPHEIANVCGEDGLKYMIDSSKGLPLDFHFMLPSCVPATPYESTGAAIDSRMTKELLEKYDFLGLGEMMDFVSVLLNKEEVIDKIKSTEIVDGHAPGLKGKDLYTYVAAGVKTDHECTTVEEALEKISLGMYVQMREGTSAKNIKDLIGSVNDYTMRRVLFCTDDKHLDDIMAEGTISNCIARAVELGLDPISAITIATLNAAECYGLKKIGAVAPGYKANIVISEDITARKITEVYKDGELVAKDGKALFERKNNIPDNLKNTNNYKAVGVEDFKLEFDKKMPVIEVLPDTLYTNKIYCENNDGLALTAVIERHKASGNIGKAYVKGFNLKNGAVAQTIGHDSHNITVVGTNPEDMALAVNSLGKDGGISVVINGEIAAKMILPIAGLMSDLPAEKAVKEYVAIKENVEKLAPNSNIDTLMMLSFLSLLVIPEIKVNDHGLFDVNKQEFFSKS